MKNNIRLIKADFITCQSCAFSEIRFIQTPEDCKLWCVREKETEHPIHPKCYCEYWEEIR